MDTVFIESLEVDTVIGAYDWERTIRQNLLVDVQMGWIIVLVRQMMRCIWH